VAPHLRRRFTSNYGQQIPNRRFTGGIAKCSASDSYRRWRPDARREHLEVAWTLPDVLRL